MTLVCVFENLHSPVEFFFSKIFQRGYMDFKWSCPIKQLLGHPYDVVAGIPESIDQLMILFDTYHDVCHVLTSFVWSC